MINRKRQRTVVKTAEWVVVTNRANDMCAEYSVRLFVSDDLHKAVGVVVCLRPTVRRHRKLAHFVLHVLYDTRQLLQVK